jgi:hypothetical protein
MPTPARETFTPAAEAHPARSEQATAEAGIVKVADEIVREDYRSAPPVHTPVPAPVPPAPVAAPAPAPAGRHAPPPAELEWPSDLMQVESNPDRVKAAKQAGPTEDAAPRPRRERPLRPPVAEEPLVQVETGGKSPAEVPPA